MSTDPVEFESWREKRRWRRAYEYALRCKVKEFGTLLVPSEAAQYADNVIAQYRLRKIKP